MRWTRRNFLFHDLFDNTFVGFIVAGVIVALLMFSTALWWGDSMDIEKARENLYLALQGKEVDDEGSLETARIIRKIHAVQQLTLDDIRKISELAEQTNSRLEQAVNNWDDVMLILEGSSDDSQVQVHVRSWDPWWRAIGLGSYAIFALAMSTCYALVSSYRYPYEHRFQGPSLTYPWHKWWSYPFVPFLLPFLLISQPILAVQNIRIFISSYRAEDAPDQAATTAIGGLPGLEGGPVRPQGAIDRDREAARTRAAFARRKLPRSREHWHVLSTQKLDRERSQASGHVAEQEAMLSRLGDEVEETQRGLAGARARSARLEEVIADNDPALHEDFDRQLDALLERPMVRAVEVGHNEIKVYTETVYIDYDGHRFEIGDFLIQLIIEGDGDILIDNLCNTSNSGYFHPHSGRSGSFCFGYIREDLLRELQRGNYVVLVDVIILALREFTQNGAYHSVVSWKEVVHAT